MKRIIRLTETQFKSLVAKNVKKIINEQFNVRNGYGDGPYDDDEYDHEYKPKSQMGLHGDMEDDDYNDDNDDDYGFNDDDNFTGFEGLDDEQKKIINLNLDKTFKTPVPISFKIENKKIMRGKIIDAGVGMDNKKINFDIEIPTSTKKGKDRTTLQDFDVKDVIISISFNSATRDLKTLFIGGDEHIVGIPKTNEFRFSNISELNLLGKYRGKTLDSYVSWLLKKVRYH